VRRVASQGRKERKVPFMKKVLMVVAMLLLATPVFAADVTITATASGVINKTEPNWTQTVTVGWSGAADACSIRAFALILTTDGGKNLDNIAGFVKGESNATSKGFGVFPGKFRQYIDVLSPTQSDWLTDSNYNPIAPATDFNSGGYSNTPRLVVELGTLYQGDANAPGTSGTLFTIDVNNENFFAGHGTDCNMCIALEMTRGGVVKKDGTAATVTLPAGSPPLTPAGCIKVSFPECSSTVPNIVGMTRANALSALAANNCYLGTEVNGFGGATAVGSVYAQSVPAGTSSCPGPLAVGMSTAMYPIKTMTVANSMYVNWVTLGKPACWAYPRQCRGDYDGKKGGPYWVSSTDLTSLRAAYNKSTLPAGGTCADTDHKKGGPYWVSSLDLTTLRTYYNKAEASVPVCGTPGGADANYWYFCVPTGATCPTGVTCATVGSCPNTP
jgi:hypothetical protein